MQLAYAIFWPIGGANHYPASAYSGITGAAMTKPLLLTKHANAVMHERQIALDWVVQTVAAPQWSEVDPDDPEVRRLFSAVPERGGRFLRVVCVETATEIRILSAFLDRRARPK